MDPAIFVDKTGISKWGKSALTEMGKLLALDVLINNWDRFPFIWQHEGNIGNLLFLTTNTDSPVVGIDQCVTSIIPFLGAEILYKEYMTKVRTLITELLSFDIHSATLPTVCPTLCTRLLPFINDNTMLKMDNSHLQFIVKGMIEGIVSIAENITLQKMEGVYKKLYEKVEIQLQNSSKGDKENCYGLAFVLVPFLVDIVKIFVVQKSALQTKHKTYYT